MHQINCEPEGLESTNRGAISFVPSLLPLEFRSQKSASENRS